MTPSSEAKSIDCGVKAEEPPSRFAFRHQDLKAEVTGQGGGGRRQEEEARSGAEEENCSSFRRRLKPMHWGRRRKGIKPNRLQRMFPVPIKVEVLEVGFGRFLSALSSF